MKKISIEARASQLRETVVDLIDAVVEESQARRRALRVLPEEVVAAIVGYLKAEHAECPRCGGIARVDTLANEKVCMDCWRTAKEAAEQQEEA